MAEPENSRDFFSSCDEGTREESHQALFADAMTETPLWIRDKKCRKNPPLQIKFFKNWKKSSPPLFPEPGR
jgi:hypothetical protein